VTIPYRGQALGARFHVQTALLYAIETSMIDLGHNPEELGVEFYD
jgi:propanediol dehydratase large subunit